MTGEAPVPDRHVPLEGARNFRDAGGYLTASGAYVRWRTLFRADSLAEVTADDIGTLRGLGLAVAFDLRTQAERDDLGVAPLAEHGVSVRHTPLAERIGPELYPVKAPVRDWTPEDYAVQYTWLLEQGRGAIGAVVRALAGERPTALAYNCTAGRDRTGLVTAVILRALGVSDEDIVADYHLTDRYRPSELGTPAENMTLTLHAMDERWPSIEAYLEQCEVTAEALRELREHLLEPGPGA
ncbi:MAG: tyrosine-protein phosphatase [Chloroflexi bacterium]|nr:tyrosine-protein phosphatase [Chloroflexota bacterium]